MTLLSVNTISVHMGNGVRIPPISLQNRFVGDFRDLVELEIAEQLSTGGFLVF